MFSLKKSVVFSLLVLIISICRVDGIASTFMPLVTNYAPREALCRNQNWDASQDDAGVMYFASSEGLLEFDGYTWNRYNVPGDYIVRSVYVEGSRIYVGSYEEFGYFQRNEYGTLQYYSLSALLPKSFRFHDEEIWKIVHSGPYIYFQSFSNWFKYDGTGVSAVTDSSFSPLYFFKLRGNMYSQAIGGGLYAVSERGSSQLLSRAMLHDDNVVAMLDVAGTTLLCTESNGLLAFDGRNVSPFHTAVDAELKANQINRAIVAGGDIIIGTIGNGVYAITSDGNLKWHYCIENGIGNNSILGLYEDKVGNVWVMLDYGVALIHTSLPYSVLTPDSNEPYVGMVYAIYHDESKQMLYIGSNQGLYRYSLPDGRIMGDASLKSQIWHISNIDNQLFVGNNVATYVQMRNGTNVRLPYNSTDIKRGVIHGQDVLVESSYYSLRVYLRDSSGQWRYSHDIDDFGTPVRQIEIDYDGAIWCAHMAAGVIRVKLTSDLKKVSQMDMFKNIDDSAGSQMTFVMKLHGKVVVSDKERLYSYNHTTGKLEPNERFLADLPTIKEICGITNINDNLFWISSKTQYNIVEYKNHHYKRVQTVPLDIFSLQSNGSNNRVYIDSKRNCYFTINNAIGRFELGASIPQVPLPEMRMASVSYMTSNGDEVALPISGYSTDNHGKNNVSGNIKFRLSFPNYNCVPAKFMYEVNGSTNIKSYSSEPEVSFAGLPYGGYMLHASLLDDDDNVMSTIDYDFNVARPAYLEWWAILLYVAVLLGVVYMVVRWNTARAVRRRERDYQLEQAAQNVRILQQEQLISQQRQQLLETELSQKGKELASMAFDVYSKQQVIQNLRDAISEQRHRGGGNSQILDNLMRTINSEVSDTEFWQIFQKNFDLIHESFFRNLRESYPSLTPIDLKFCALLRLNLSTKDISRFTNLTIRGVETARYRLRRKFGIKEKESLVQFLIDFNPEKSDE